MTLLLVRFRLTSRKASSRVIPVTSRPRTPSTGSRCWRGVRPADWDRTPSGIGSTASAKGQLHSLCCVWGRGDVCVLVVVDVSLRESSSSSQMPDVLKGSSSLGCGRKDLGLAQDLEVLMKEGGCIIGSTRVCPFSRSFRCKRVRWYKLCRCFRILFRVFFRLKLCAIDRDREIRREKP